MHELSSALSVWRRRFESEHELGREHVDELESHLAESAAELASRGLDAEEAVLVAAHRLGSGDALRAEYAKVHPLEAWSKRVQWMLAGYLGITALVVVTRAMSDAAAAMVHGRLPWPWGVAAALSIALVGFAAVAWTLVSFSQRGSSGLARWRECVARLASTRRGASLAFVAVLCASILLGAGSLRASSMLVSRSHDATATLFGLMSEGALRPQHVMSASFGNTVAALFVPALAAALIVVAERRRGTRARA